MNKHIAAIALSATVMLTSGCEAYETRKKAMHILDTQKSASCIAQNDAVQKAYKIKKEQGDACWKRRNFRDSCDCKMELDLTVKGITAPMGFITDDACLLSLESSQAFAAAADSLKRHMRGKAFCKVDHPGKYK